MPTAMHCIGESNAIRKHIQTANGMATAPDRVDDMALLDAELSYSNYPTSIYYGSNYRNSGQRVSAISTVINPNYIWKWRYGSFADKKDEIKSAHGDDYDLDVIGDLALIKLSEPILQTSASILDAGNITNPYGKLASLSGWGLNEYGYYNGKLHNIALEVQAMPTSLGLLDGINRDNPNPLSKSLYDLVELNRVDDGDGNLQQSDSGDSGSPITLDGFTIGMVSGKVITDKDTKGTSATGTSYWISEDNWLVRNIDSLNTVGQLSAVIDKDSTDKTWTVPVQSLKIDSTIINSTSELLGSDSNDFTIDSDCNPTLNTGEYCHITVTYSARNLDNSLKLDEGESVSNTLVINDDLSLPVVVAYPLSVTPTPTPDSGGSGGSMGVISFFTLLGFVVRRKVA